MSENELVIARVECEDCGKLIIDDAIIDKRLIPFLQTKKGLCEDCRNSRQKYIEYVKTVVKEKFGVDVDIPLDDPESWWYVVG